VLNSIIKLAEEAGFGLTTDIDFNMKSVVVRIYTGTDRTYQNPEGNPHIVFTDNPKNIDNLVISNDYGNFANFAYVAGEGEGSARVVEPVPTNPPEGTARHEIWVDARNVQRNNASLAKYRQILYSRGVKELNARLSTLTFTGDPVTDNSYEIRRDYELGDMVTCDSRAHGIRFDTRVERVTEIAQYNSTIVKIQLGKPTLQRKREADNA